MTFINSAYHYYLSAYANSATSRYDTHKRSELRNVCNNILKINKESPLYKIRNNRQVPSFLIDVKENARQIKNVVSSLSDSGEGLANAFQKKLRYLQTKISSAQRTSATASTRVFPLRLTLK